MNKYMYFSTAKEMEKLDDIAVAHGLEIRQMMELAGWHMLALFQELNIKKDKSVLIVCGKGNKGGDGLSAARHLLNHGYKVSLILTSRDLKEDPKYHLELLEKMSANIIFYDNDKKFVEKLIESADIIIDALLGYHLDGNPRGNYAELIDIINKTKARVISYDIPSGVDASSGECLEPCIKAQTTLTLALPKKVFENGEGLNKSGEVFLIDIGIPDFLYDEIAIRSRPDFGSQGIIKIT